MREIYHPDEESYAYFKNALHSDLGLYHIQRGGGIGGFFTRLFKTLIPVGKSLVKSGIKIARPHLEKAGKELVIAAGKEATKRIGKAIASPNKHAKTGGDVFS